MNLYFLKKRKKLYIFIFVLLVLSVLYFFLNQGPVYQLDELEYGVTFSKKKAEDLGLDWKKVYLEMLDGLEVKNLRVSAYWDETEKIEGTYEFDDLDWQVAEAANRRVKLIMAAGGRLPRWPECHFPKWADEITKEQREAKQLRYLKTVIERYRNEPAIAAWQVENEPFLGHFGICPTLDSKFLDREIALVKQIDITRPIVVTDSGELSLWVFAAMRADIFGTTMYRDTYSEKFKSYIHYPITPAFFRIKKNLAMIFAKKPKEWIVIELQAEPWAPEPYQNISKEERDRTMNHQKFKEMMEFARKTGFRTFYLWGVEFWYWDKYTNGDARMWEEVRGLLNGANQ